MRLNRQNIIKLHGMAKYHKAKPFFTSFLAHKVFEDVIKILHIFFYHRMRNRMNVAMIFFFSLSLF